MTSATRAYFAWSTPLNEARDREKSQLGSWSPSALGWRPSTRRREFPNTTAYSVKLPITLQAASFMPAVHIHTSATFQAFTVQ